LESTCGGGVADAALYRVKSILISSSALRLSAALSASRFSRSCTRGNLGAYELLARENY